MSISSSPLIVGLMAATALGAVAFAQEVPAPQPPAPPAAPVAAPATTEAQPPAAPAAPAAAAAAPAGGEAQPPAAPAEQVVEAPKPPEPPPVLPTSGDGAVIVDLLNRICRPLVEGRGQFEPLVKAAGFKKDNRLQAWVKPLSQRPFEVHMTQPGSNNANVCSITVRYAPGWDAPIVDAMNIWRFLHDPQLRLKRNDIAAYTDKQRTTTTWDNWENQGYDGKMIGLILVQLNAPDGAAINKNYDEALIQYSQRKALDSATAQGVPAAAAPAAAPAQPAG